jgi:hypothetical protein
MACAVAKVNITSRKGVEMRGVYMYTNKLIYDLCGEYINVYELYFLSVWELELPQF